MQATEAARLDQIFSVFRSSRSTTESQVLMARSILQFVNLCLWVRSLFQETWQELLGASQPPKPACHQLGAQQLGSRAGLLSSNPK
jgi:hypothetical protein